MRPELESTWLELASGKAVASLDEQELAQALADSPKLLAQLRTDRWIDRALAATVRVDADAERFSERFASALASDEDEQRFVAAVSRRLEGEGSRPTVRRAPRRAGMAVAVMGCAAACALAVTVIRSKDNPVSGAKPSAPLASSAPVVGAARPVLTARAPVELWRDGGWAAMPAGAVLPPSPGAAWRLRSDDATSVLAIAGGPQLVLKTRSEISLSGGQVGHSDLDLTVLKGSVFVDTAGSSRAVAVHGGAETIKPMGPASAAFVAQQSDGLAVAVLRGAVQADQDRGPGPVAEIGSGVAAVLGGPVAPIRRPIDPMADFGWTSPLGDRRETVMKEDFEDGLTPRHWDAIPIVRCPPHPGRVGHFCVGARHYSNAPSIVGTEMKNMQDGFFTLEPGLTLAFDYWIGQPSANRSQITQVWMETEPGAGFHYDLHGVVPVQWVRVEIPFADFQPGKPNQRVNRLRTGDLVRFIHIMVQWSTEDVFFVDNVEVTRRLPR